MLIVDGSVVLSPYVLTILRGVEPSNLAIADTLDKAIGGARDPSFTALADFYGMHGSLGEALRKWAYQCSRQLWSKEYRIVEPPDDEKAATIFNYLLQRFGPVSSPGDRTIVCMLVEQMWGAIGEGWPILALGSPTPRMWEMIEELFPEQTSKRDLRLIAVDPTAEFRKYGIPTVALAELDPWLIDVLAPSPTMVEYLTPGEFVGKLKFVAFSIESGNSDESID